MTAIIAEYIWIDGQLPTAKLRSKTKILYSPVQKLADFPNWNFDGSSTEQAVGHDSDVMLKPVTYIPNPLSDETSYLVLCETYSYDGTPHVSNTRHVLAKAAKKHADEKSWFGIEQEYTLYGKNDRPYNWPIEGFPHAQGRYYCGVGFDEVHGRPLVEEHLRACLDAGLQISGVNAEVMPAQWEYQVGPLGPLEAADQLWLSRYLLYRIGEEHKAYAKLDPKPMFGDWNGAGAHTNFSTEKMRTKGGYKYITEAAAKLGARHDQHISIYGADNDQRLSGEHETCHIDEFRWGVGDRGASVRVSHQSKVDNMGYLEDRRPAANMDPYKVATAVLETTCGSGFDPKKYGWNHPKHKYI